MPIPFLPRGRAASILAPVLLLLAPLGTAAAQDPAPTDSAAAAAKQLELGEQWFRSVCFECHANGALVNADFRLKWSGRTAFELFESIRSTMPENDPGSLTQGTYAAVVAYLMKVNGQPVGTAALPADSSGLAAVKLLFAPTAVPVSTPRR